jgi:hypothetical protein
MEIPAMPIFVEGDSNSPLFKEVLVKDIITNIIYKFKYINFMSN